MNPLLQSIAGSIVRPAISVLLLISSQVSNAQCITPPDQTFGTYEDLNYGESVAYECMTYTGYSPGTVFAGIGDRAREAISLSPLFSGSALVIGNNSLGGGYAELRSTNGNSFAMKSLVADFYGHRNGNCSEVYDVVGYRDNNEVVKITGFNVTASAVLGTGANTLTWVRNSYNTENNNSGTLNFGSAWGNIDALRFYVVESAPFNSFFVALDNLDFDVASAVLPATFGNVSAVAGNGTVEVQWTTLSETNNQQFEIQLSRDGNSFTGIKTIPTLAPGGSSAVPVNYHVVINGPSATLLFSISLFFPLLYLMRKKHIRLAGILLLLPGITFLSGCQKQPTSVDTNETRVFLRVAQVDQDGRISYSKTVKVVNEN